MHLTFLSDGMDWTGMEWNGGRSVVDPSGTPRAQTVCASCVLPSCAEVVVFDGRVTPHGTWVPPNANSTQWPFFGLALIVQSHAV